MYKHVDLELSFGYLEDLYHYIKAISYKFPRIFH